MHIIISNTSGIPIYEQIYEQIKGYIVSGEIKENYPLPSIRGLAKDLRISVITTKRAYEELERCGYIYTLSGKGSFVAERNTEIIREEYLREIEEHIERIIVLSKTVGLTRKDLVDMLELMEG